LPRRWRCSPRYEWIERWPCQRPTAAQDALWLAPDSLTRAYVEPKLVAEITYLT
jgi:hypothetical protein